METAEYKLIAKTFVKPWKNLLEADSDRKLHESGKVLII